MIKTVIAESQFQAIGEAHKWLEKSSRHPREWVITSILPDYDKSTYSIRFQRNPYSERFV